jgi:hypothetical protein
MDVVETMCNLDRIVTLLAIVTLSAVAGSAPTPTPPPAKAAKQIRLRELVAVARACAATKEIHDKHSFELVNVVPATGTTWKVTFPEAGNRGTTVTIDATTSTCNGQPVDRTNDPKPAVTFADLDLAEASADGNRCAKAALKDNPGMKIVDPTFVIGTDFVALEFRNDPPNGLVGSPWLELGGKDKGCHWNMGE